MGKPGLISFFLSVGVLFSLPQLAFAQGVEACRTESGEVPFPMLSAVQNTPIGTYVSPRIQGFWVQDYGDRQINSNIPFQGRIRIIVAKRNSVCMDSVRYCGMKSSPYHVQVQYVDDQGSRIETDWTTLLSPVKRDQQRMVFVRVREAAGAQCARDDEYSFVFMRNFDGVIFGRGVTLNSILPRIWIPGAPGHSRKGLFLAKIKSAAQIQAQRNKQPRR